MTVTIRPENSSRETIRLDAMIAARVGATTQRCDALGCSRGARLRRLIGASCAKPLRKQSRIKSGFFYTVKATVKYKLNSAKPSVHTGLLKQETIEWE